MRCVVPKCKNDSRHISKTEGITFHVFPTEAVLRTAWLRALGKGDWQQKNRSAVCSEHFLADDLYWTKNGLRKVRTGAIPLVMLDSSNCDYGEPSSLKICRICLAMNTNLFSIGKYKLEQAFENLTGVNLHEEERLPRKLCYECSRKLLNSNQLRIKALRANTLMLEILKKQDALTIQSLQLINRENNQLNSTLSVKSFEPDHSDVYIEHEDKQTEANATTDLIKDETNKIFIEETDTLIDEVKSENGFADLSYDAHDDLYDCDDDLRDDKDNCDDNNICDDNDDCDAKHVNDFSSDDSLPLTQKVKKKKTKRVLKKVKQKEPKIDRRRRPFLNPWNDTLFTIIELSKDEQIAEVLKRKESANYKNSVYKCIECFKGFLDEDAYNSHMMRHTIQSGAHRCDICKTHFRNNNALRKHLTAHHMQRFSCNQCSYVTTHRQTARLHERWHKGTKYKCPHCPDEFVKFTTYMGHIRIKHPSDFVCGLCGYSFVSEKGIDLHKKLKHRVDEPMEIPLEGPYCEVCEVRFLTAEALATHVRVSGRHATEKAPKESNKAKTRKKPRLVEKEKCDAEENDRRIYPSQLRKAEGPIPCEQCGLQLEDSRAYHGHFRRMHPDKNRTNYPSMRSPCMCEVCGRIFQSFALLRDHTWLHTGERPFKCELCGKAFRMKQRLVAHRRVHSQEKATYDCSVCGKHFSTHSNRQRHMFIHTGLKPFKCEMCGKGFKHASEKRAHIEYVHMKKPWPKRSRGKRRQERPQEEQQWGCDPKMDMVMMDDKPMYYNLKM